MSPFSKRRHGHILENIRICLVRPSYPENVGAVARAMQVTGFKELVLLNPHELADLKHPNALKMAVGSDRILENAEIVSSFEEAVFGYDIVVGTSGRARVKDVLVPKNATIKIRDWVGEEKRIVMRGSAFLWLEVNHPTTLRKL